MKKQEKRLSNSQLTSDRAVVACLIYKGRESYDSNGNIQSENQIIRLVYGSRECVNFLLTAKRLGWTKLQVVQLLDSKGDKQIKGVEEVSEEFLNIFQGDTKVVLTPEQEKIAELERKIAELSNTSKPAKVGKENNSNPSELEELQKEYHEKAGKKPHHLWKEEKLREEIAKLEV